MFRTKYIIRKRALGDVLWTEPVIRELAGRYEKLVVHTKYNELFRNYPLGNVYFKDRLSIFDKLVIRVEKMLGISSVSINLDDAYERRRNVHFLHAYQQVAKLPVRNEYPKIYLSDAEKTKRPFEEKYVVLHLESFAEKNFRKLFGIDWKQVIAFIQNQGYLVVQAGISQQKLEGVLEMKTSLRELISLVYHSSCFIGLDSGPSHIAAALKIPAMIFFGAVDPAFRHFPGLFSGKLMKNKCEYDGTNADLNDKNLHCNVTDSSGNPVCCVYETGYVIQGIRELLENNVTEVH